MHDYYRKEKIISLDDLEHLKDIIFISGCFDVLHYGHLYFFREAKKKAPNCNLLVVTHDDNSIMRNKGSKRPIIKETERIELLTELEIIDYVALWKGWENIQIFYKKLKPKYIAVTKGEYKHKTLSSVVEKTGSKMIIIDKVQNRSSSQLVEKMGL